MMKYDIVEVLELSGAKAHIYSIRLEGEPKTLLDVFFDENRNEYKDELNKIAIKLSLMGHKTGSQDFYFKEGEGNLGDGVCAIRMGRLRLYCIRYSNTTLIIGSGGYKPATARTYQEVPKLNGIMEQLKSIAAEINQKLKDKDWKIDEDGILTIENYENEEY